MKTHYLCSLYRSWIRLSGLKVRRRTSYHTIQQKPVINAMDTNIEVKFQGEMDRFRGVTVTSAKEPCPLDQLEARLAASLAAWRQEGVRAVWFQADM